MNRRTLGVLIAGGLVAATAVLAIPVTPDPARDRDDPSPRHGERFRGVLSLSIPAANPAVFAQRP